MGRVNIFTDGVFSNITGTQTKVPEFLRFLNNQDLLKKPKGDLKKFLDEYKKLTESNKETFERLSTLEDVILQLRAMDNLTRDNIKLNVVREYIYARTTFHRKDISNNDIRVIVGQTDEYGDNLDILLGNKEFMDHSKEKLITAMNEIINQTTKSL